MLPRRRILAKRRAAPQRLAGFGADRVGTARIPGGRRIRAFTDTFQDLPGLDQLPGISVQRLMADGYGFGAEGDWKTAALVRTMKVMSSGMTGGTSFMEDYTYHFDHSHRVLGAHMLEICPTIAAEQPTAEIHPLSIGGRSDPVRLVFTAPSGPRDSAPPSSRWVTGSA